MSAERDPLHPLLAAMFDRELTEQETAELRALLETDDEAMRRYIDLTTTHALLGWEHAESEQATADTPRDAATHDRRLAPLAIGNRRAAVFALAAAVLLAAAVVAIYFVASGPQSESRSPRSNPPIATLIDVSGGGTLLIDNDVANPGSEYGAGRFAIESGSASLQITSGASVRLNGHTRMTLHSPMRTSLEVGQAAFNCPGSAVGFAVDLPGGARVVDLGTAFVVRVDADGRAWTEVTEGAVRIDVDDWSYLVSAGEGVRIAGGEIEPLNGSSAERLAMRLRADPALISYSPMDNIGNAIGRVEGDKAFRPAGVVYRLPESDPTRSFTLAAWVNVESLGQLAALVVSESNHPGRVHWQLQPGGDMSLGTVRSAGADAYRSTGRIGRDRLNRWVHLAVVVDSIAGVVRFYIDGEPSGVKPIGADDLFDLSRAALADSETWPGRALPGRIDDLIVLGRGSNENEINEWVTAGPPRHNQKETTP